MIEQFIKDVEDLLEWMPVCSVGSTGHTRRLRVEAGIEKLKIKRINERLTEVGGYGQENLSVGYKESQR